MQLTVTVILLEKVTALYCQLWVERMDFMGIADGPRPRYCIGDASVVFMSCHVSLQMRPMMKSP